MRLTKKEFENKYIHKLVFITFFDNTSISGRLEKGHFYYGHKIGWQGRGYHINDLGFMKSHIKKIREVLFMRYTHKLENPDGNCNYFLIPDKEECDNAENKLGQLEDILEEFNILDLSELRIALENERKGTDAFANWWEKRFAELLKPYKDIENELGISIKDYFKLFELIDDDIWTYSNNGKHEVLLCDVNTRKKTIHIYNGTCGIDYPFSEYKKSWALTEKELGIKND